MKRRFRLGLALAAVVTEEYINKKVTAFFDQALK
jgi:hypothetical protein